MLLLLLLWAALGGTLYTMATTHPPMEAFLRWLILMAALCLVGGLAIRAQPLGEATVLLLFYLIGMWMANAGATPAFRMRFVSMSGMVLVLLASSIFLWFRTTGAIRNTAVIIAAIPLGVTLLYGAFVAVMVLVGGKARWN